MEIGIRIGADIVQNPVETGAKPSRENGLISREKTQLKPQKIGTKNERREGWDESQRLRWVESLAQNALRTSNVKCFFFADTKNPSSTRCTRVTSRRDWTLRRPRIVQKTH